MKNYMLMRFVKLNLYFFIMYSLLTCIWYGITGRFKVAPETVFREVMITSAFFSLAFSVMVLLWFRRTSVRIPVKQTNRKELQQKVEALGYAKLDSAGQEPMQVYKPVPPKASAMAGKIFIQQNGSYYNLNGPAKFLKLMKEL